jgi:tRNA pseudouridine38-40 synthase
MHLLAVLEYDGTDFLGFQTQKSGRTVQGELERALGEFNNKRIRIVGGGRTDAGVHATGQTASFTIDWTHGLDTLTRAINSKLPRDVAVHSLREVPEDFSARHDAVGRTYRYRLLNAPVRSPLCERYALWIETALDVSAMASAASALVGRHDFGAFGTPPQRGSDNTIREMRRAEVRRDAQQIDFEFEADAFLYRMVRRLVGTLLQVGSGTVSTHEFREVLKRQRRAGDAVPPRGLTLMSVTYSL